MNECKYIEIHVKMEDLRWIMRAEVSTSTKDAEQDSDIAESSKCFSSQ